MASIANNGPWKKLAARRGVSLKFWWPTATNPNNPYSVSLKVEDLLPLISEKTRLIAFTACSNILGSIVPVKDVVLAARAAAKEKGAKKVEISVDCVAYAPHRLIDVKEWDVDYCVFSYYKVSSLLESGGEYLTLTLFRSTVLTPQRSTFANLH